MLVGILLSSTLIACGRPATTVVGPRDDLAATGGAATYSHLIAVVVHGASGHVAALDVPSLTVKSTFATGFQPEAVVDSMGSLVFVLSTEWDGGPAYGPSFVNVLASPSLTMVTKIPVQDRVIYPGQGPRAIAVSPDGTTVFIYHYAVATNLQARYWVTAQSVVTHVIKAAHDLPDCGPAFLAMVRAGQSLAVTCQNGQIQLLRGTDLAAEGTATVPMQLNVLKPDWTEITAVATANQGNTLFAISRNLQLFRLDVPALKGTIVRPPIRSGRNSLINQLLASDVGEVWFARDDSLNVVTFAVATQRTAEVSAPGLRCFALMGPEIYVASAGTVRRTSGSDVVELLLQPQLPDGVSQLLPSA
jgi:hypothetical protein